jgi:8-oxo-dGTP pyrophosphatase MutT (NUDIX family)
MDLRLDNVTARLAGKRSLAEPWIFERSAAVALILRYRAPDPELLLMRRVDRAGDPWSGHVSLPGGRGEPGDASVQATAVREVSEEVGIDLASQGHLLGNLEPLHPLFHGLERPLHVTPFVYVLTADVEASTGAEARRVFWLPLAEVVSGSLDSTLRYTLAGLTKDFPCWRYAGEEIWGLTYRIVQDFLGVVAETRGSDK